MIEELKMSKALSLRSCGWPHAQEMSHWGADHHLCCYRCGMLVPRSVRLRCKDVELHNPQVDEMPVIAPPPTVEPRPKSGLSKFLYGNYKGYYSYRTEESARAHTHRFLADLAQAATETAKMRAFNISGRSGSMASAASILGATQACFRSK